MGALERNPGKADNWIEKVGGLDPYLEKIAESIHERHGKSISDAVQIAWGMIRKWAVGGDDVKPDTRAKAAKAVANMEAKRARWRAMRMADLSNVVDAAELAELVDLAAEDALGDTLDLAYGDHKPPYDWKHGYKPISPQAMRIKAKKESAPDRPRGSRGGSSPSPAASSSRSIRKAAAAKKATAPKQRPKVAGATPAARDAVARGRATETERQAVAAADAPPARRGLGLTPSTPQRAETDRERQQREARDRAAAEVAQRGRQRRGEEAPTRTPSTPSGSSMTGVSSTDLVPNRVGESPVSTSGIRAADLTPEQARAELARLAKLAPETPAGKRTKNNRIKAVQKALDAQAVQRRAERDADPKVQAARARNNAEGAERRDAADRTPPTPPARNQPTSRDFEAEYVAARRESRREGATMAERAEAQRKAASVAREARRYGRDLDEIALDERARQTRDTGSAPAAPSGRRSSLRDDLGGEVSRLDPPKVRAAAYREMDGPALAREVARRGIMSESRASGRSDAQLRTALREHDKNPSASNEDNARARSRQQTPEQQAVTRRANANPSDLNDADARAELARLDKIGTRTDTDNRRRDALQKRLNGRSAGSSESGQTTTPEAIGDTFEVLRRRDAVNEQLFASNSGMSLQRAGDVQRAMDAVQQAVIAQDEAKAKAALDRLNKLNADQSGRASDLVNNWTRDLTNAAPVLRDLQPPARTQPVAVGDRERAVIARETTPKLAAGLKKLRDAGRGDTPLAKAFEAELAKRRTADGVPSARSEADDYARNMSDAELEAASGRQLSARVRAAVDREKRRRAEGNR